MALKFCFCVFWKGPTFPALLQFSLNTTVIGLISYLRPGSGNEEWRRGETEGTQPTAGSLHASVAMVWEIKPPHQLLFSCLKAVYERIREGHQWLETGINQKRKTHQCIQPCNVHKGRFCYLRPFPEISHFVLFITSLQKHISYKTYQPAHQNQSPTKGCSLWDFPHLMADREECKFAFHQAGVSNHQGNKT